MSGIFICHTYSQCTLEVEATGDAILCEPGGSTPIQGNILSGEVFDYFWQPEFLVDDPNSLSTNANVTSNSEIIFTGRCLGDNTIVNGDFEQGNTGFTSEYIHSPTNLFPEGTYAVLNNPNSAHPNFAACSDHTSGNGQMMVVNGETTLGAEVWCETIAVTPNTNYVFECWVTTVVASNPAQLQFSINGLLIGGIFQAPSSNCVWEQFNEVWNSGGNSSAEICITNQNTIAAGNDFALDDIFFGPLTPFTDTVFIDIAPTSSGFLDTFACAGGSVEVNGESYEAPGSYDILLPGANVNGCDSMLQLNITETTFELEHIPPAPLDCNVLFVQIDASGSTSGPDIVYIWTTDDGTIINGQGTPVITVNEPGTYTLQLQSQNGSETCLSEPMDVVVQDLSSTPEVWISEIPIIDCSEDFFTLIANTNHPDYIASWSTNDGNIISGQNSLQPVISEEGVYELYFLNTQNNCDTTISVTVNSDISSPTAVVIVDTSINCQNIEVTLNGTASSPAGLIFQWSSEEGHPINNDDTPIATVTMPGRYLLTVSDPVNGCSDTASVLVQENTDPPALDFPDTIALNCKQPTYPLVLSSGIDTTGIDLSWSPDEILEVSGDTLYLTNEGILTISALDRNNYCTADQEIMIEIDTLKPAITDIPDTSLNCENPTIVFTADSAFHGSGFISTWESVSSGQLDTSSSYEIRSPGRYIHKITSLDNGCSSVDSFIVDSNDDIPVFSLVADTLLSCVIDSVIVSAQFESLRTHVNISWESDQSFTLLDDPEFSIKTGSPGWYHALALDTMTGCSGSDSLLVEEILTIPEITVADSQQVDCSSPNTTLVVSVQSSDPVMIAWDSPDGSIIGDQQSDSVLVSGPGTYFVSVSNATSGCAVLDSVIVTSNESLPLVDAGEDSTLTCTTTVIRLDANGTPQTGNISFEWSTNNGNIQSGGNTLTPVVDRPGQYVLSVTNMDNGCTNQDAVTIDIDTMGPLVLIDAPLSLTCEREMVTLSGQGSGDGEYLWTTDDGQIENGEDTPSPTISNPGTYLLTFTSSANGCEVVEDVAVVQDTSRPDLTPVIPGPLTCEIFSVELGFENPSGGPYQFNWIDESGDTINTGTDHQLPVSSPGSYNAVVVSLQNGCYTQYPFEVFVDTVSPTVSAGPDVSLSCVGSAQLDGSASDVSGDVDYTWSAPSGSVVNGSSELQPAADIAGLYILTGVSNSNGCQSIDSVTVGPAGDMTFTTQVSDPSCGFPFAVLEVDSVSGGTGPFELTIEPGGLIYPLDQLPELSPGSYDLTLVDADGCEASLNLNVPDTLGISASLPSVIELEPGQQSVLTPQLSIPPSEVESANWTGVSILCDTCLNPPIVGQVFETVYLSVVSENGCTAKAQTDIVLVIDPRIYVPNAFSPNGDGVNDVLSIFSNESIAVINEFQIFNRWGDKVHERFDLPPGNVELVWDGRFNEKIMDNGVFVYHITATDILGNTHFLKGEVHIIR